jgi:hypothetical protein
MKEATFSKSMACISKRGIYNGDWEVWDLARGKVLLIEGQEIELVPFGRAGHGLYIETAIRDQAEILERRLRTGEPWNLHDLSMSHCSYSQDEKYEAYEVCGRDNELSPVRPKERFGGIYRCARRSRSHPTTRSRVSQADCHIFYDSKWEKEYFRRRGEHESARRYADLDTEMLTEVLPRALVITATLIGIFCAIASLVSEIPHSWLPG